MARPRPRRTQHRHASAWAHVLAPAWTSIRGDIDAVLASLGDPLRTILAAATGVEFIAAAWEVPNPGRTRFLTELKVPAARRPSAALEDQVGAAAVNRMCRWNDDHLGGALRFLMQDPLRQCLFTIAHAAPEDVHDIVGVQTAQLLGERPAALVAAALIVRIDEPAAAALLAEILISDPLPGCACDPVTLRSAGQQLWTLIDSLPWDGVDAPTAIEPGDPAAADVFDDYHQQTTELFRNAAALCLSAAADLKAGALPDVNELTEKLGKSARAFGRVWMLTDDAAAAAGIDTPGETETLDTLRTTFETAQRLTDPHRAKTERLATLGLPADLVGLRTALTDLITAADNGDNAARDAVANLLAVDAARSSGASTTDLHEAQNKALTALPASLQQLPLAMMLGTATLPALADAEPTAAATTTAHPSPPADQDSTLRTPTAAEQQTTVAQSVETQTAPTSPTPSASHSTVTSNGDDLQKSVPESETGRLTAAVDSYVFKAVRSHDTGLAYWLAETGGQRTRASALRAAALAEAVRTDHGPLAATSLDALEQLDPDALANDKIAQCAALAAALRTTLVTGNPDAGAVLEIASACVTDHVGLSAVAKAVAQAAQRGALAGGQLTSLRATGNLATDLAAVKEAARTELARSRTVLLPRASDMGAHLFSGSGTLGTLLSAVAADDRNRLDHVEEELTQLSDPVKVRRLVDDLDRQLRGPSGKPLQGKARNKINDWIAAALEPVRVWIRVVRALTANDGRHVSGPLRELRDVTTSCLPAARSEILAATGDDPVGQAAAILLADALESAELLLSGRLLPASPTGSTVEEILGRALLRAPGIALDSFLRPIDTDSITIDSLCTTFDVTWPQIVDMRIESGDFATARVALAVAVTAAPDEAEALQRRFASALELRRTSVKERQEALAEDVRKATRLGRLSDEDNIALTAAVKVADPDQREDLGAIERELAAIAARLPDLAKVAADLITLHLETLVKAGKLTFEQERRVREQIDGGDLAGADEVLAAVDADQPIPEPVTPDMLIKFFPQVPDAMPNGITAELLTAVRSAGTAAGCAYSQLPEQVRAANTDALAAWRAATSIDQRHKVALATIAPALRLAGIEALTETLLSKALRDARSNARRFVDLADVNVVGNAVVPAFGSELDGRLRLLLVWGPATAQSIVDWLRQDHTDEPVLVCHFGTFSASDRRRFAVASKALGGKPVVVLDDAALAFLAARPEASATATMRLLLPFTTLNPYVPQAEGNVPGEMFYGRTHELSALMNRSGGTSLVYGGRQLGKSALLRAAQRRHNDNGQGVAVYVPTPPSVATDPKHIWDALRSALEKVGIKPGGKDTSRDAYVAVTNAVESWLANHPGKRILVLFDECDLFFDTDAIQRFAQTARLRDLRNATGERFKPVFAGLHEVARFASLPNQPLDHLGKPAPIGPLAPAEAFRLVTEPLAALGITFDESWKAWRILAYCNYQPILLQLVCQHLVRYVHDKRDEFTPVPYVITEDEFEHVWMSPALQSEVAGKLRLTLELDPRYSVVACVLGHAALSSPKVSSMSTVKLRRECDDWWSEGFVSVTQDEFRALLIEMATLGVLAHDGSTWQLRSDNVLRMLGTRDDIETRLFRAAELQVPGPKAAAETRRYLKSTHVAPLTEGQLTDLIGQRNQLRIVLGTAATGADLLAELLRDAEQSLGTFTLVEPANRTPFREALTAGERGTRHRVVFSDVTRVNSATVHEEIQDAVQKIPPAGVTRCAVLTLRQDALDVWMEILDPRRGALVADSVVACRRLDAVGLERWSHDQRGQFTDTRERDNLAEVTGGWPMLIDVVAAQVSGGASARDALAMLRSDLDADLGHTFMQATGLLGSTLEEPYAALVSFGVELLSNVSEADVESVIAPHHARPQTVISVLVALGALDRHPSGSLSLESVLATRWAAA